jgi:ankyrin repeat protein
MRALLVLLLFTLVRAPAHAVPPKGGLPLPNASEYVISVNGLLRAIEKGDYDAVSSLLDRGAKVNDNKIVIGGENAFVPPSGGDTPLIRAVQRGRLAIVQLLLKRGADVNLSNLRTRVTALHYAAGRGDVALTRLLLDHNAQVNVSDVSGTTPLMWATEEGHLEMIRLLLERGANPDVQDRLGRTALMLVMDPPVRIGVHRLVEPLNKPILRLEITQALVAKRANLDLRNQEGYTALMLALEQDDTFLVRILEKAGASTEGANEARLHYAAGSGDLNVVQELLAKGANPNARNRFGETALMRAALMDQIAIVKTLLAKGADVNAQGRTGTTALMIAAKNPHIAKPLLDEGADIYRKDINGDTVFFFALRRGHPEVVQMLLDRGFDVRARLDEYPPLIWAAKYLNVGAARVLLDRGADIHAKDRYGNTALHHVMLHEADLREMRPILELLLSRGADINARNGLRETPLILALRDNLNITPQDIQFLRERGAIGDTVKSDKDDP